MIAPVGLLFLAAAIPASGPTASGIQDGAAAAVSEASFDECRAAWGGGLELSCDELDPVLVRRYAMTGEGRSSLDHLLKTKLLERLAAERRVEVGKREVDARMAELDAEIRASGSPGGLEAQLREGGVDEAEFRELLRIAIVQELLCRDALGIPPDAPVSGDSQELWIQEEMTGRGLHAPPPPWEDGIAGRCGAVVVTAEEYLEELRGSLSREQVRETCYQLLLAKGIRARMPDLSQEAYERAITAEIERRRRQAESDPRYRGIPFERLLSTQGLTLESLRLDPSVEVTALAQLWALRTHDEDALVRAYREDRASYDGRFGEALRAHVLFVQAAERETPRTPRTFEQATALLEDVARDIDSLSEFEAAARRHSEDSQTRARGGELGWLFRTGAGLEELRTAAFEDLARRGPLSEEEGRMLGPVRTEGGVALLWLSEHRPAPSWERMREHVRNELRREFLLEILPRESLVTYLDA